MKLTVRLPCFQSLVPTVVSVDSSIHLLGMYLFSSCYMSAGMRSIRLGTGATENNAAEKMVVSFKNDSDSVAGRENL